MKVRRLTTKYLLKRVASGLIPEQIIDKPKIGLFNAAVDSWFDAQAQQAIERLSAAAGSGVRRHPRSGGSPRDGAAACGRSSKRAGQLLLSILMLEVWLTSFLPRAMDTRGRPATAVS